MKYSIISFRIKEAKQIEIISYVKQEYKNSISFLIKYFIEYLLLKSLVSLGTGTWACNPST